MKQLTDNMIKNAFDELALDNKYFDKFKEVAEYYYSELQRDCPDDDEDNSNADESIRFSKEFMKYYVPEKEKGHCDIWAETYANCRTHWLKEYKSYRNAYNALEEKEHPEKELDIHVASMSTDPLFRERYEYKFLCSKIECDPKEAVENYCNDYRRMIALGKSEIYAALMPTATMSVKRSLVLFTPRHLNWPRIMEWMVARPFVSAKHVSQL